MRTTIGLMVFCLICQGIRAQSSDEVFKAVRAGDLAKVKTIIEAGTDVNVKDRYGLTPLAVCAQTGQKAIAGYLIKKKADLNLADTFYDVTPLSQSLWNQHPEVAVLLAKNGAEPRDSALEMAAYQGLVDLAKAAVEGGPIYAATLERLRANESRFTQEIKDVLKRAKERPDLPPPAYTAKDLKRFVGNFEGFDSDTTGKITLKDGTLHAAIDQAATVPLKAVSERTFVTPSGEARLVFVGRAGNIEGFRLMRGQGPPDLLRHSVAEPMKRAARDGKTIATVKKPEMSSNNWAGFRGPGGTGIADGSDLPLDWDLASGKGVAWQADLDGLGNSSPVIWGDKVFVTTAIAAGMKQELRVGSTGDASSVNEAVEHSWLVYGFDKKTGKKLWTTEIARAKPLTERHFKATQANSTPATDGRHLVVVFPTAGLACLNYSGKILWHHKLGGLNASAFYSPETQWGFASSPIIYKSMVILQVDVFGEPFIAAWDLASGKEMWRMPREVATSWTTPAIFPTAKGDELVVNGSTIYGYKPSTGEELWSLGPNSEVVIAAPVIADGVVYVTAGYPPVKPIYAIREGIRGSHQVKPGETHPHLMWSHKRGGGYMPTPLLYRGLFFLVHHNGRLVVYDAATGDPIHKTRFSQRGTFTNSPIAANGRVYLGTEEGILYIIDAKPDFKELAVHDFDEPLMATPAASEGTLYVRTPSKLIALGSPSSK